MKFWIWSNEHGAWWRADSRGYTHDLREAGTYSVIRTAEILEGANLPAREFGHPVKEFAVMCTIVFDRIPAEVVEVERESIIESGN